MLFGSPKGIHYLNPIRYHGAFIENTCCHQPPSIVTQSIRLYDHFKGLPIGQSLMLILVEAQYPLKIKSPCSIVVWWIMTIDSLASWFTVGCLVCITYTSALIIGNSSRQPRQAIPLIMRYCMIRAKICTLMAHIRYDLCTKGHSNHLTWPKSMLRPYPWV